MLHIYFGNGKGKTTAAIGQVIRAMGRGFNVAWIQYCKNIGQNPSGEIAILNKLGIDMYQFAPRIPLFDTSIRISTIKKEMSKSIILLKKLFNKKKYDLLVLDELNVAIEQNFIKEDTVVSLLKNKPDAIDVIITGRGKHKKMMKMADLVTEMKEIKHPFNRKIPARKGIEY